MHAGALMSEDNINTSKNNFSSQWLEAQGKLDGGNTHTDANSFIAKHKTQATYLTHLGGAVTVGLDGSWNYLLNQEALSQGEDSLIHDSVTIESSEGLVHELKFDIEVKDAIASVSSVHYINPNNNDSIVNKVDDEPIDSPEIEGLIEQDKNDIQEDIDPVLYTQDEEDLEDDAVCDVFEDDETNARSEELDEPSEDEVAEEGINEEILHNKTIFEIENTLKDEQAKNEKLLKVQALMNKRQEETVLRAEEEKKELENLEDIQEEEGVYAEVSKDTLALEEEKAFIEEQAENEKLLRVQALMDKRHEEAALRAKEEKDAAELEEEAEPTPVYTGDDEMLLKVQALMNAKKSIDVSDIEFTGEDTPSKKEETEAESLEEEAQSDQEEEASELELHEEACLKGKIVLDEADGTEIFTSSFYLEGFILNNDGSFTYEPHDITHAYLAKNETQSYHVDVEVKRADSFRLRGSIELIVTGQENEVDLSFTQGQFYKIEETQSSEYTEMSVDELAETADEFIDHHTEEESDEEGHGHLAVVFDSLEEGASLHSDGTLGITVMLPTGAQSGEAVIINSSEFVITDAEAEAGQLLYSVYPDDEVEVSFRDSDNNISDSIRAKANQRNIEILEFVVTPKLTGEVGAQSMHASVGVSANPQATWGIMTDGNQVTNYVESAFGSVHIDGETGELEYKYHENSGLDKYGSSADTTLNENFILYLGKEQYAELEVSLHIQAQNIHGYSGHQIDSTTIDEMKLLKIDKSKAEVKLTDNTQMIQMLESGLQSNKTKISKVMLEIYEAKSTGVDVSEAKQNLQALTDQKTHLEDKLNSLK